MVRHQKEKIVNAITYFLENSGYFGKKKLYKLLFLLDFEHFKQTGRSVTGFNYFAWRMGPVPAALDEVVESPDDEFAANFEIERAGSEKWPTVYLKPKSTFEPKYFSRRELRLMHDIAERFAMATGDDMVWFTHRDTEPWHLVWEVERRQHKEITYDYALIDMPDDEKERILETAKEREAFISNYS